MTTLNTHQQLARNSDSYTCGHPTEMFCINCLNHELILRRDSRYDVAAIAMLDLRRLAKLRAEANRGSHWRDAWHDILDPDRLDADLNCDDSARRSAAEAAQQSFGDFLAYRDGVNTRVTPAQRIDLLAIERRVRQRHAKIEREGVEPEVGFLLDLN